MPLEVKNCCFCADLRTGSFIIGYLGLIWSIVVAIIYILALVGAGIIQSTFAIAAMSILLGIGLIRLIFFILLLVGLHKYKPGLVKAFLIYGVVFTIFGIILFIMNIVGGAAVLDIVINIVDLLLNIYFLIVIRSYCLRMTEPDFRPEVVHKPELRA